MRTLVLAMVLLLACSHDAGVDQTSMKALNDADLALPDRMTKTLTELSAQAMVDPGKVADLVETKVVPVIDGYLLALDRADAASDHDPRLDTFRRRGEALRKARERFVTLEHEARGGASGDDIQQHLFGIGLLLNVGE